MVTMSELGPIQVGSIRNFGWVVPGMLARGEQPELQAATFEALREAGVSAVVSLRPDREAPSPRSRRRWPEYHLDEERALASAAGLAFGNVPLEDFSAQPPAAIAAALHRLDALVAQGHRVYVHCQAGAGRAGLVSGAWGVTRGLSGDDAADNYWRFMEHIVAAFGVSDEEWRAFALRVGQPHVWWTLREVVAALGSPITREPPRLLAPERPPYAADDWEEGYRTLLAPWRRTAQP